MPIIPFTMEARKLLYTVMVFAPAMLMAGIGIHARAYVDPFEWPDTRSDHDRTNEYVSLASKSIDAAIPVQHPDEALLQEVAKEWIEGERQGKLRPLTPVTADEMTVSGIKSKIYQSLVQISRRLIEVADRQIEVGEYQKAAENLILASDSLAALKYSDFMSLYRTGLSQQSVLDRFESIYLKLEPDQRKEVRACSIRMKGDLRRFAGIARHSRNLILQSIKDHQNAQEAHRTASRLVPENTFFELPAAAKSTDEDMSLYLSTNELNVPNQRVEARQCMMVEERNRLRITRILSLENKTARL